MMPVVPMDPCPHMGSKKGCRPALNGGYTIDPLAAGGSCFAPALTAVSGSEVSGWG